MKSRPGPRWHGRLARSSRFRASTWAGRPCHVCHGFTLVELLVVIGVISVLAAIILPVVARTRESGRQSQCQTRLMAIAGALRIYLEDFDQFPPPYDSGSGFGAISSLFRAGLLASPDMLRCPDDPNPLAAPGASWNAYYNYYGYQANGIPVANWAGMAALYNGKTDTQGRPLWIGPPTDDISGAFPGLYNRNAPMETIVAYCPYHKNAGYADFMLVVRLGGQISRIRGGYDWVTQP